MAIDVNNLLDFLVNHSVAKIALLLVPEYI
jgi:hypothetical protein